VWLLDLSRPLPTNQMNCFGSIKVEISDQDNTFNCSWMTGVHTITLYLIHFNVLAIIFCWKVYGGHYKKFSCYVTCCCNCGFLHVLLKLRRINLLINVLNTRTNQKYVGQNFYGETSQKTCDPQQTLLLLHWGL
jgi:hypothetical protein